MKKIARILCFMLSAAIVFSVAACAEKTDRTKIEFWYGADIFTSASYSEMVTTYNNTQGKTDGVYVKPYAKGKDYSTNLNYTLSSSDAPNVVVIGDTTFRAYADQGFLLELDSYFNNDVSDSEVADYYDGLLDNLRFTNAKDESGYKRAGVGANLVGMPNGVSPSVIYYNSAHFKAIGINIISIAEEDIESGSKLMPHGYAEYLEAPIEGLTKSKNLAGEDVYKVFNDRIPMNWDEMRYLSKSLTKEYNDAAPAKYGYLSEYWFSYGWSVGGDCVQWDDKQKQYVFSICDEKPNYLVTASEGVTVNNVKYSAGEIISYNDREAAADIDKMEGLTTLPSQYQAFLEINRFGVPSGKLADTDIMGYGIARPSLSGKISGFTAGSDYSMVLEFYNAANNIKTSALTTWGMAPLVQYKEYAGGSTYQKNGNQGFDNEYLKVIGETYTVEGKQEKFTGEKRYVDNTAVQGKYAAVASYNAFCIAKNSDPELYEASWKFIQWASGAEAQAILAKGNSYLPNQKSIALSDEFLSDSARLTSSVYGASLSATGGQLGDWSYFDSGEWITNWSNPLNNDVRYGSMTLSKFNETYSSVANNDLKKVEIHVYKR